MVEEPILERVTVYIRAPAERVWEGITKPEILNQYWDFIVPLVKIDPRPDGEIYYGTETQEIIRGKIIEFDIGKKLVHTYKFTFLEDPPTRVSYEIKPMGEMCELTLKHDGFPSRNETFGIVSGGWEKVLCGLKTVLETGKKLPWPEEEPEG